MPVYPKRTQTNANPKRVIRDRRAEGPRRRRRKDVFPVQIPERAQTVVLHLPVVRAFMVTERRTFLVELYEQVAHLVSQNAFASLAGISSSQLSMWRKAFAEQGRDGLAAKPLGPRTRRIKPCKLEVLLAA